MGAPTAMTKVAIEQAPVRGDALVAMRVRRIAFVDDAPAGEGRRRFTQPRRASAVESEVAVESLAVASDRPERIDQLVVVYLPESSPAQSRERAKALVATSDRAEATRAVTLEHGP